MMIAPVAREHEGQCEHRISGRADSELLETIGATGAAKRKCPFTMSADVRVQFLLQMNV